MIRDVLLKRRLPVDPQHNAKIERGRLPKSATRQLSGSRFRGRRVVPIA